MTDEAVEISITIRVAESERKIEEKINLEEIEETIQRIAKKAGQESLEMSLQEIDKQIAEQVPRDWQNVGTEERWLVSSIGVLRYKRRIYLDEKGERRKPVDELLGIEKYSRMSGQVQEMGASLACMGTYRLAASQLSYMIKTPISHSAVQRMAWTTGNRIADGEEAERRRVFEHGDPIEAGRIKAPVLYGESDGVWVHLQREKHRSAEVRVATINTGRKQIGKDRYRFENKRCITAIGLNSEQWQEQIVRETHLHYDLSETKMLISGGDGNQWVRHSFDRMDIPQEFVLDRFHLRRAARRTFRDKVEAKQIVTQIRKEGFSSVTEDLRQRIKQAEGREKQKLEDFYRYIHNNQDGLLDLDKRGIDLPAYLGGIEGNVDKLVVHRMKGRGRSWRLPGLRAMLALCRNCDALKQHSYRYLPLSVPTKSFHRVQKLEVEYSEVLFKTMPILHGPDQDKPWVKNLCKIVHDHGSLFSRSMDF
ncbi:MAG: ISLre2 family transposase [Anaerolineaceae bacterium]|nr:ISLre2 family transposase [Anaerolineaceae bacterium]